MKYICKRCGEIFNKGDKCPDCGSYDFAMAKNCKICGEKAAYEVCADCMDEMATSENALEIGAEYKERWAVEVNGFFAYSMTEKQIDEALREWWAKKGDPTKAYEYCHEDKSGFAEWCARKYKGVK